MKHDTKFIRLLRNLIVFIHNYINGKKRWGGEEGLSDCEKREGENKREGKKGVRG